MNIFKKLFISLFICTLCILPVFLSSCFLIDMIVGSTADNNIKITPVEEKENGKISDEEFISLIENEDFLETFNTFYYPTSQNPVLRQVPR